MWKFKLEHRAGELRKQNIRRTITKLPVGSRHSDVFEGDLPSGLHVPPHLLLFLAEAEAGGTLGDHDA